MTDMTAVQRGYDFKFNGARYQVKGNRPTGKPGEHCNFGSKNYQL